MSLHGISAVETKSCCLRETDEDYRAALVYVRGYTPNGKGVVRAFWVRQHPAEGIPSLSPKMMAFFLEGGKQTALFNKANYPYSGVFVSEEGKKWAHAEMDSKGVVTVTVDATKDEQGRSCTVVCWASNSPTPKESEMVQLPITVNQQSLGSIFKSKEYLSFKFKILVTRALSP